MMEVETNNENKQGQDASEEEEDDWTYCTACKRSFETEQSFYKHLRGMAHINNSMNQEKQEEKTEEKKDIPKPLPTPVLPTPKRGILKSCLKRPGAAGDQSNNVQNTTDKNPVTANDSVIKNNGTGVNNGKDWGSCSVCDLTFNSEEEYNVHVKSSAHMDKSGEKKAAPAQVEKGKSKSKSKQSGLAHCDLCDITMTLDRIEDHNKGSLHQLKLQNIKREEDMQRKIIPMKQEAGIPNEFGATPGNAQFRCETCGINCNAANAYERHLGGIKHKKKLKAMEAPDSVMKSLEANSAGVISLITKDSDRISVCQREIDESREPCIGLDHIEENVRSEGGEVIMKCTICDLTMQKNTLKPHVLGAKHRRKFMDKHYPEYYEMISDKGWSGAKKSEQTQLTEKLARQIEIIEGRALIKVKEIIGEKFDELVSTSKKDVDPEDRDEDRDGGGRSDDRRRERSSERERRGDRDGRERSHDRDRRERPGDRDRRERSHDRDRRDRSHDRDRRERSFDRDRRGAPFDRDHSERGRRDLEPFGRGSRREPFDPYARDPYARGPEDPYLRRGPYDYMPPVYPPGMPPYDPYSGWGRVGQLVPTPGIRPADLERLERFEKLEKKVTMDYSHRRPTEPKFMKEEDAIEAYLDDFNKKRDGDFGSSSSRDMDRGDQRDDGTTFTKRGVSAMEEAKNAQDAASAVMSDAPNIPTIAKEFLASLRTCLIKNDNEADIAMQVSNSLTRDLINYRIDENEKQEGYDERIKDKIAGLIKDAGSLRRNIKIPKAIIEAAAVAKASSLLASIPGLDVPASSSLSGTRQEFQGYTIDDLPKLTSGNLAENQSSGGLSAIQAYSDTSSPPRRSLDRGNYPRQYSDEAHQRRRSPSPLQGRFGERDDRRYSYDRYDDPRDSRPPPRRRTPPKAFQRSRSRSPQRKMSRRSRSPFSRSRRSRSPYSRSRRSRSPYSRSRRSRSPYSRNRRSRSPYSKSRGSYKRPRESLPRYRSHVKIGRKSPPPRKLPYPVRYKRSRSKSRSKSKSRTRSRSSDVQIIRSSSSSTSLSSRSRSRSRSK